MLFNFSFLFGFEKSLIDTENFFIDSYEVYETEEKPKEAVIVQRMKISTLDPALTRDEDSQKIVFMIYETLFKIDEKKEIENSLAEKYKWISERELYLKLKEKVFFHDNSELTASDVKKSLEFLKQKGVMKNMYSDITDIKVLGKYELIIKISEEDTTFLNTLAYRMSSIAKRDGDKIYGTGRYRLEDFQGKEVVLKKFENYHEEPASLETVTFRWEMDGKQRLISLFNDNADVAMDIEKDMIEKEKAQGLISEEDIILPSPSTATTVILFGKQNDFSLEMKRNFEKLIKKEADTFFPEKLLDAKLSKIDNSYIEKEIKKLREKIKYKKELDFIILNTVTNMRMAQEIKDSLKKAGLNIRILPHQVESYNAKIDSKDFDLALYDIEILNDDLVFLLNKILLTDTENIELYNALQPFFKIVKDEKDKEKRDAVIDKMASLIYKNVPYVILEHHKHFTVISSKLKELLK